jgi:predicted nucleic acid-binding protein
LSFVLLPDPPITTSIKPWWRANLRWLLLTRSCWNTEIVKQKYGIDTAHSFIALLSELPNVQFINTYYHWRLIAIDPDDNKYCDCAIASQADFIVTEDKHFNVLREIAFPPLQTISASDFSGKF